jgi:hypothetical protein
MTINKNISQHILKRIIKKCYYSLYDKSCMKHSIASYDSIHSMTNCCDLKYIEY